MSTVSVTGRLAGLRRKVATSRALANQAVLALQDRTAVKPLQGKLQTTYQRALSLYERAAYRIDHVSTKPEMIRANRTAAKALLALKARVLHRDRVVLPADCEPDHLAPGKALVWQRRPADNGMEQ